MNDIDALINLDWHSFLRMLILILIGLVALLKLIEELIRLIKPKVTKFRELDQRPKNDEQDKRLEELKARQDILEDGLSLIRENVMISTWDRIVHFGMNYIRNGHISYAEKDIFLSQAKSYDRCGGNGHLKRFVPMVENLPFTEDLTEEQRSVIESDNEAKRKRIALAEASLSAYYL